MKWLRTKLVVLTILSVPFATLNAHAGTVVCGGTVETIAYHANNQLMLRLSSMNTWVFFCNLESDWNVVAGYVAGTQTCKSFFALFLAAKESGRTVNSVGDSRSVQERLCDVVGSAVEREARRDVVQR